MLKCEQNAVIAEAKKPVNAPLAFRPEGVVKTYGIGRTTLYGYLSSGQLPSRRIGGIRLIRREDIEAFIESFPLAS